MKFNQTTAPTTGATPGSPSPLTDLDASGNPNYPAAVKGDRYRITVAGKVGGASGKVVEAGDVIEAVADNAGGTESAVGTSWIAMQANIAGMTAAGLAMIQAANAAAQQALVGITGGGTLATGGFTLTVPATGTAALLGTANVFTLGQTIQEAVGASALTLTGATQTASHPVLNMSQTWNNAAVDFTGLLLNVTNTASASGTGTRLVDFQIGGASRFRLYNDTFGDGRAMYLASIYGSVEVYIGGGGYTTWAGTCFSHGYEIRSGGVFTLGSSADVILARRGAAMFGLGNASATPVTQVFGGSEAVGTDITGGVLNIGTRGTGTGTGGVINFQSHAAGSTGTALGTLVNVFSIIGPGVCRITGIPTSSAGLSSGDIYSNAGILTIVT